MSAQEARFRAEAHEYWRIDEMCRVMRRGAFQEEGLGRSWQSF
jgi:hypothetical protein